MIFDCDGRPMVRRLGFLSHEADVFRPEPDGPPIEATSLTSTTRPLTSIVNSLRE